MIRALGGLSAISGLLVVLAYQITLPIIAENQKARTERAVFQVIPGAVSKRDFVATEQGLEPAGPGVVGQPVYAAYDAQGKLQGIAITGTGSGYGGPVTVMFNYNAASQAIVGSRVLQSTETPGFGDKLDKDPTFLKNVEALDVRLNAEGTALANPVATVKNGTKKRPWEVDAISGATISSKAFGKAANLAAQGAAPAIQKDLAELSAAAPTGER
jgi:electron transport complex protein RnfG